jgi:hypothetical protein
VYAFFLCLPAFRDLGLFCSVLKLVAMITFSSQFTMPSVVVQKRPPSVPNVEAEILAPGGEEGQAVFYASA